MEIINKLNLRIISKMFLAFVIITSTFTACDEEDSELPGVGGIEDDTPPLSEFTPIRSDIDPLVYKFKNNTRSATDYLWTIPAGATVVNDDAEITEPLKEEDITVRFPDFGSYEVSLTSSDKNNATSTVSQTVEVVKPVLDPPSPDFSFELKNVDFTILDFVNESNNTARIIWVLPMGATLYDADPSDGVTPSLSDDMVQIKFPGEGTYDVTLKAFNAVDDEVEITKSVEVSMAIAPTPEILNPTFSQYEVTISGSSPCSCVKWVNTAFGDKAASGSGSSSQDATVLSPINNKEYGGLKFDDKNTNPRAAYQKIDVTTGASYTVRFYTKFKKPGSTDTTIGNLEFKILDGAVAARGDINATNTLAEQLISDPTITPGSTSDGSWVLNEVTFTATSTSAGILVLFANPMGANVTADILVDNFTIEVNP